MTLNLSLASTVKDMKSAAKGMGLKGYSRLNKADLFSFIESSQIDLLATQMDAMDLNSDNESEDLDTLLEDLTLEEEPKSKRVEMPASYPTEKGNYVQKIISTLNKYEGSDVWMLDTVKDKYFEIYFSDTDKFQYRNFEEIYHNTLYLLQRKTKIVSPKQSIMKYNSDTIRIYF